MIGLVSGRLVQSTSNHSAEILFSNMNWMHIAQTWNAKVKKFKSLDNCWNVKEFILFVILHFASIQFQGAKYLGHSLTWYNGENFILSKLILKWNRHPSNINNKPIKIVKIVLHRIDCVLIIHFVLEHCDIPMSVLIEFRENVSI